MSSLLFNAAVVAYVCGLLAGFTSFFRKKETLFRLAIGFVVLAFCLHSAFLLYQGIEKAQFPMTDLRETLAFLAWTVSLCFLIAHLRYRIDALTIFLLPMLALLMLVTVFVKASPVPKALANYWVFLHATCLMLSYGMLFVTFIAGSLYLLQEHELKSKRPRKGWKHLPSLVQLDSVFLHFLVAGFCAMTIGLLAGVVWAEQDQLSGWHRDPRVISAVLTWGIYLVLIYLRLTAGWRGRKAAWLSMAGFVSALFAFWGANYFGGYHAF